MKEKKILFFIWKFALVMCLLLSFNEIVRILISIHLKTLAIEIFFTFLGYTKKFER